MTLHCIYSRLCILVVSLLIPVSSLAQDKQPNPEITRSVSQDQSLTTINARTSLDAYIKVYREALSKMRSAEDELIIRPQNWMHAARYCYKAIEYLPTLKVSASKIDSVTRSKMDIHRVLKEFCAPVMEHALSKIDRRSCKAYWMLRKAFKYFEQRDAAYWKPRLKKLRGCK